MRQNSKYFIIPLIQGVGGFVLWFSQITLPESMAVCEAILFLLLVQRILSNWQFDLPISLIALLPKPRRSHRYACVCEAALSEKYSASNYPKLNFRCTRQSESPFPHVRE